MTLTIIIATRGRIATLRETVTQFLKHMELGSSRILVAVDADDDDTIKYLITCPQNERVIYSIKPRELTRGMKYDRALTEAPADVYLIGVDHTVILTPGFDRIINDAAALFPDGVGCVSTPMANASFPYLQAPTAKLCKLMGYIQPPQFPFWFIDHWLDDIARMIGRYVMVDVECDSSRRLGKTTNLRHLVFWTSYFDMLATERRAQANRIIDAMDEPHWRKRVLRQSFPMVEYRSQWVNAHVRGMSAQIEAQRGDAPDANYIEALRRANDHMIELTGGPLPEEKAA